MTTRKIIVINRNESDGFWSKAEPLIKSISLLLIPLAIAVGGWWTQDALTGKDINKDYVELAVSILSKPQEEQDSDLRSWAVKLINETSPVKFEQIVADKLKDGSVELPALSRSLRETDFSTISALDTEKSRNAAKSIGLFQSGKIACSAFLISTKYVITADICYDEKRTRNTLRMGFDDSELDQEVLELALTPKEKNSELGYAIFKITSKPANNYSYLLPLMSPIGRRSPLIFIHHPWGKKKSFSKSKCNVINPMISPTEFSHNCNSTYGTSGGPLIDSYTLKVVGIHFKTTGSNNLDLGIAKSIRSIYRGSTFLKSTEFINSL